MEITIKIIINPESKETPIVKVEQQPEVKPTEVIEEVKPVEETKEVKEDKPKEVLKVVKEFWEDEEPKKLDFKAIRKNLEGNFSNLRNSYDYQTLDAYKTIIPTFHKYYVCTFQIGKVFQFFGHTTTFKDFAKYYNNGLITIGKENIYDSIVDWHQTDVKHWSSQIAWQDDRKINGYLLLQFKREVMLLKIIRSRYQKPF